MSWSEAGPVRVVGCAERNGGGLCGRYRGLHQHLEAGLDGARRREAALVADERGVAAELALDDLLEVVEDLAADLHRLGEGLGAGGDDEELLERQLVAGVLAAVDDVEARHRHGVGGVVAGEVGEVLPERHALGGGAGLGGGHRDREHRVGAELLLVLRAVQRDHLLVDGLLVRHVHADELLGVDVVDRGHGALDALAHVARAAVAQLAGLVHARGGAGRHDGAEEAILSQRHGLS